MAHRSRRSHSTVLALLLAAACQRPGAPSVSGTDPRTVADELLAVDRAFATAAGSGALAAIANMVADDVWMPTGDGFARDKEAALSALRVAFGSASARAEWTPVRGGISADGQHGFTFGYMALTRPDSSPTAMKYLSYWVKLPSGWRVVAYRVTHRPAGHVSLAMMDPALPARLVAPSRDGAALAAHTAGLIAAEREFSDLAQAIGIGPAFVQRGSADAVNMGGPRSASFVVGSEAIGKAVSGGVMGPPSPVRWAADRAIVAASGDLGVTFGVIRPNAVATDTVRPPGFPFFTIWRRTGLTRPWRYIAE